MILLSALLEKLINKLPWITRLPLYFAIGLIWLLFQGFEWGMKLPQAADEWFDKHYDQRSAPIMIKLESIESDVRDNKQDTRDIKNHLMGRSK